jgi:hypothetical protein
MRARGVRLGRDRRQRGAAAVEFALVCLFLVPLLLGIIDFGFYFNDSLNLRQGVREGARIGAVKSMTACTDSVTGVVASTDYDKLRCQTRNEIGSVSGPIYLKAVLPTTWTKGQPLVVCGMVKVKGATGFVPLPHGGFTQARTRMSIETAGVPGGTIFSDTLPVGSNWSWCS